MTGQPVGGVAVKAFAVARSEARLLVPALMFIALVVAAVAGANLAMFVGGIGMYLLLTLITRYAQTPYGAGYGFGLTTFVAGLVLNFERANRVRTSPCSSRFALHVTMLSYATELNRPIRASMLTQ